MSQTHYQIIISGQIIEGFDLDTVKHNVARLFNTEVTKIEPLFSGQAVVVKKGLDETAARKYMMALRQAGLASKGRPMNASKTATSEKGATTVAAAGEILDPTPAPPPAQINTEGLTVAAVGETLVAPQTPPPPEIDISGYQTEAVGVDLDRTPPPVAPEIDTSHINIDEVGATLDETLPFPAPNIDTSNLTMAEAGEEIIKHAAVPPAKIDTSKLQLMDE